MYEIIKPEIRYQSGKVEPEERRTFLTAAGLLRWALDERLFDHRVGGVPYPTRFGDKWLGHPGKPHYGMIDTFCRWQFTPELRMAMQRVQQRYGEIVHYLREVEPEWRPDVELTGNSEGHLSFADNSTELHEINKYGKRRHRFVTAPHGDVCF